MSKQAVWIIDNNESVSDESQDITGHIITGLHFPDWTAADVGFTAAVGNDGEPGTFVTLFDLDGEVLLGSFSGAKHLDLRNKPIVGARWLKLRSGTAASPVNQGAARTVTAILEPM